MKDISNRKYLKLFWGVMASVFFALIPLSKGFSVEKEESRKTVSFEEVWAKVKKSSLAQKALASESKAADIAKRRSSRHWLPRVYADLRSYTTNDPTLTFMSKLGQRSITQSDFMTDELNKPGTGTFQRGTLGLDLPLYEGGVRVEAARALEKMAEAKRHEKRFSYLVEYSAAASTYGEILLLIRLQGDLKSLKGRVDSLLARYQGGLRSNLVEYSGILGLKSLKNRLAALMEENEAKIASLRTYLEKMSGDSLKGDWAVRSGDVVSFADTHLREPGSGEAGSFQLRLYEARAESARSRAEGVKSVFLPRIGVFSEAHVYNGDRNRADSYNMGFYVTMNLVTPTEYGALEQARLESDAARSRAKEARRREEIELRKLRYFSGTLKKNITLLQESTRLMDEQVKNAQRLFANGSIKAFQLVEVLSRKTDLMMALAGAENEYLHVRAGLYGFSQHNPDEGEK